VFVGGVPDDKLPKDAVDDPTAALRGTVTWAQSSPAAGGGACPAVHKVWYLVQVRGLRQPLARTRFGLGILKKLSPGRGLRVFSTHALLVEMRGGWVTDSSGGSFFDGVQAKAPDTPAAAAGAAEEAEEEAEVRAAEAAHAAKVTVLKDMKVATPEQWAAAKKSGETLKVRSLVHSVPFRFGFWVLGALGCSSVALSVTPRDGVCRRSR
jgi:hypothetical protein